MNGEILKTEKDYNRANKRAMEIFQQNLKHRRTMNKACYYY